MNRNEKHMSISTPGSSLDAVLGSFYISGEVLLDELGDVSYDYIDFTENDTTDVDMLALFPHQDTFFGLQPDSSAKDDLVEDWGALDDQIYQLQLQQREYNASSKQLVATNREWPAISGAKTNTGRGVQSVVSSSNNTPISLPQNFLPGVHSFAIDSTRAASMTTLSRSNSSTASIRTDRGRPQLQDKPQRQRLSLRDTSSFQEHVFNSDPARSTSRASASSGRHGPLDAEARATMSAVKEVGACWRCSTLRKSVSIKSTICSI